MKRRLSGWHPLVLLSAAVFLMGSGPYRPESVHTVTVSNDGAYLGYIDSSGDLRVVDLARREELFQPPRGGLGRRDAIYAVHFAAFDTAAGRLIWNCGFGQVCWRQLATGEQGILLEHDPQDDVRSGLVSADGSRMVFGTVGGRLFTFDPATGEQRELKPRDVWSARSGLPIHTLAGTSSLDHFVSATSLISPLLERFDFGERQSVRVRPDQRRVLIKHSGIVVWSWDGGGREIFDGFEDRIRAAFSPGGERLMIRQETAKWRTYRLPDLAPEQDALPQVHPASGVAFLDPAGDHVGMVSYASRSLEVVSLATGETKEWQLALRRTPAGGPQVLASLPDKGWVFVGLKRGGVDWYRFSSGDPPSLKFLARLR